MASSAAASGREPGRHERKRRGRAVPDGHLPVSEFLSDRPGASSPFGDDQAFPLPVSALAYQHPTE